jgi:hypothetical protein
MKNTMDNDRKPHLQRCHWHEAHSSQAMGSYRPNSLFIWAHSFADLEPDGDDPLSFAISTHAHEYIHYLHNVTTISGLYVFMTGLWLMGTLAACADSEGQSRGDSCLTDEQKQMMFASITCLTAIKGNVQWIGGCEPILAPVNWSFAEILSKKGQVELAGQLLDYDLASISGRATDAKGKSIDFIIDIGFDLITEGVAYEVDREIRRAAGMPVETLDLGTPPYPYLTYEAIVEHLLGRSTTPKERICVGVAALQKVYPGVALVEFCSHLKDVTASPCDDSWVKPSTLDKFLEPIELILHPTLKELHGAKQGPWGGDDALALFQLGFRLRAMNNLLELSFIDKQLDKASYRQCISTMVDCCIIQSKPGDKVIHEWVGPGVVAKYEEDAARIGIFQASLHYTLLHVGPNGRRFHSTDRLNITKCPYSGGCQVEIDDGHPIDCRTRPWLRYKDVPLGGKVCWYAAGVKTFAKHPAQSVASDGNPPLQRS